MSLAMLYVLFVEGMWDSVVIDVLALVSALFMFGFSLGVIRDAVSGRADGVAATPPLPLVDEWIGEQGREAIEGDQRRDRLEAGEALLALIAAWAERSVNRWAVTTRRIVL